MVWRFEEFKFKQQSQFLSGHAGAITCLEVGLKDYLLSNSEDSTIKVSFSKFINQVPNFKIYFVFSYFF